MGVVRVGSRPFVLLQWVCMALLVLAACGDDESDPAAGGAAASGGTRIMWNRNNGIVYAAVGVSEASAPIADGIAQRIEASITGPNPLATP